MSTAVKLLNKLVKLELGVSAGVHADITDLVYMRWDRIHEITPANISSQAIPDHWEQGFSHVTWELGILGYNTSFTTQAVDASSNYAYDEDGDSYQMGYFRVTYKDTTQADKYTDFNNAIVSTIGIAFPERAAGSKIVSVVRGLAYYKTDG